MHSEDGPPRSPDEARASGGSRQRLTRLVLMLSLSWRNEAVLLPILRKTDPDEGRGDEWNHSAENDPKDEKRDHGRDRTPFDGRPEPRGTHGRSVLRPDRRRSVSSHHARASCYPRMRPGRSGRACALTFSSAWVSASTSASVRCCEKCRSIPSRW